MPSITTAICNTFKLEALGGVHQAGDIYKAALIKTGYSGTYGKGTQNYSDLAGDEVADGNGYSIGGQTLSGYTRALQGDTAYIDWSSDPSWASATFSADGLLIYNASQGGKAVGVYSFSNAPVSATNGTFSAPLPAPGATAPVRIA